MLLCSGERTPYTRAGTTTTQPSPWLAGWLWPPNPSHDPLPRTGSAREEIPTPQSSRANMGTWRHMQARAQGDDGHLLPYPTQVYNPALYPSTNYRSSYDDDARASPATDGREENPYMFASSPPLVDEKTERDGPHWHCSVARSVTDSLCPVTEHLLPSASYAVGWRSSAPALDCSKTNLHKGAREARPRAAGQNRADRYIPTPTRLLFVARSQRTNEKR